MTSVRGLAILFAILLALVACQVALGLLRLGVATPILGAGMALSVAFGFMHLRSAIPISRVFALAGLFWLTILFGLTAADVLFRTSSPLEMHAEP